MRARLLVIQHEDACPPGRFADWLAADGVHLDIRRGHRQDPIPRSLDEHDGLMVLGGERGAYDDDAWPWLSPTRSLITLAVQAPVPFLGICLGHQLAAVALGGVVRRNPAGHSKGLTRIGLADDARGDALFGEIADDALGVQWNQDVIAELPPGAVRLATGPDGSVQAARFGPLAWGVQFHPEATAAIFRSWTVERPTPVAIEGVDPAAAAAEVTAAEQTLSATWGPLAHRFADIVIASARTRPRVAAS